MNQNTVQITLQFKEDGSVVVEQAKKKVQELNKTVDESKGPLAAMREGWIGLTAKVGLGVGVLYGAKKILYDTGREIASMGNEIERQSSLVGMLTDQWQAWQYSAKMSDVEVPEFNMALKLLSKNMEDAAAGSGDAAKYFRAMGVEVRDSVGHLRPLNDVMLDIAGKFATWEDGPRKIAISLALFGRSGEALAPMLNKGKEGIQGLMTEAQRLNFILGKDTIAALSEAEDSYKKWATTWKISKAEVFAPMLVVFTNILDRLREMKSAFKEGGISGVYKDVLRAQEEAGVDALGAPDWVKDWVSKWQGPAKAQPPSAGGKDLKEYFEKQKPYYESLSKQAELMERMAYGGENAAFWQGLEEEKKLRDELIVAMNQEAAAAMELDEAGHKMDSTYSGLYETWSKNAEALEKMAYAGWEDGGFWKGIEEGAKKAKEAAEESGRTIESIGSQIGSVWSSHISAMLKGTESFSEGVKGAFGDMADYAIGMISKMAMNYLLLGSMSGGTGGTSFFGTSSGGYGGLIGGLLGLVGAKEGGYFPGGFTPIKAFAGGGYVNRPTLGLIGEGGEGEYIIPKSKMGGGNVINVYSTTNNNNINAIDTESFNEAIRKRGRAGVLDVMQEDRKTAGDLWRRR